ncbi:hypothetical protein K438DRAFT_1821748 [Mycena galopus ATCC 62051]|nr:hypothetical protein K438DRAFT_1821748 [Mycena galopus ATCC 62051]
MFASASGFQIHGGIFYEVAGDMNIHRVQPTTGWDDDPLAALKFEPNHSARRPRLAKWDTETAGALRMFSCGSGHSHESGEQSLCRTSPSQSSPSLPSSHDFPLPFGGSGYKSRDRLDRSRSGHPENKAIEYSSAKDREEVHQNPSNSECRPWSPFAPPQDHRTSISIGGNINYIQRPGESGLDILRRAAASDAFHDSAERFPQPKCHMDTRTEMLENLWKWSSSMDVNSGAFWLYGPAGAGKSAITQSFCQKLEAENCLGASFFFKRGNPSRGTGHKLFPTIAYQLALRLPELEQAISQVVEKNPSILDRALSGQLQKLIIEPYWRSVPNGRTLVIVIDGLDECEGQTIQQEILRAIGSAIHEGPLPLRFFVFVDALRGIHRGVNINQSFYDVQKYLRNEFARIHREHDETMATVPFPWPTDEVVNTLVRKSSGYFIFASTVIKFIDDKDFRPTERLKVIMGIKESDGGSPFAVLDQLYTQILSQVHLQPRLLQVLVVIAARFEMSIGQIEQFLQIESGDVRLTLRGLQSVIGASGTDCNNWSSGSFAVRSGIFYVGNAGAHKTDLCCHILKALSQHPNTNNHFAW